MILVEILSIMGKDHVRGKLLLQLLEVLLDLGANEGKETISEAFDDDTLFSCALQKDVGTTHGFLGTLLIGAEDHPVDGDMLVMLCQPQDRAAAADFDIIAMRPETQHSNGRFAFHG